MYIHMYMCIYTYIHMYIAYVVYIVYSIHSIHSIHILFAYGLRSWARAGRRRRG